MMYLYRLYNKDKDLIYVGATSNDIILRIRTHFTSCNSYNLNLLWKKEIRYFDYIKVKNKIELSMYELYYINKFKPEYNLDNKFESNLTNRIKQLPDLSFTEIKSVEDVGIDIDYYQKKFKERELELLSVQEEADNSKYNSIKKVIKDLPDIVAKLVNIIKQKNKINKYRDILIIKFISCFGLKISDLININLSDIDLKTKTINIGDNTYNLIDNLINDYKNYLKERNTIDKGTYYSLFPEIEGKSNALFISRQNKRISPRMVQMLLRDYSRELEVGLTPEKLRLIFIKTLMDKTKNINLLTDITGVNRSRIKDIYFEKEEVI